MTDGREVQIVHLFDAPRERVFRAWMDPDEVSRWWAPEGFEVASGSVQIEAEVGGASTSPWSTRATAPHIR
jgi:uncharacterized protein YndB with AHSA1/START domain